MYGNSGGRTVGYLNIFVFILITATICSIFLMLYTIKHRAVNKSQFLIFLSVTTYLYTFGYLLEVTSATLETAFCATRVQYMGLPFILPLSYLFVRDVYGEKRFNNSRMALMFIIPFISTLTMQMYPFLKVYYSHTEYISNGYIANCRVYPGPLYYLHTVYSYFLFCLIFRLLIRQLKGNSKMRRRQSWILLAACIIPVICSVFYVISTDKPRYDSTPIANTVSMALLLYGVHYHNLINIVPLARAQVIESMEDAFIVCDPNFNFLDANEAAKQLFPELRLLLPGEVIEGVERFKNATELSIQSRNETRFYSTTQTCILKGTAVEGVCIVFHDITENEKLLKKLRVQASFDSLMNIYNRGTLFEIIEVRLNSKKTEAVSYSLLMIDVDLFKLVNDTYGHLAGDFVLKAVATIIKESFRSDDIIGRYGGEEVVVFLENVSARQSFHIAEKLRKIIENTPILYEEKAIHVTISIGVAHSPAGGIHSFEGMLNRADAALYAAKDKGRNCTIVK
ncbi:MAG: diguanylate cyclase [Muricomes sp.]